MPTEFTRVTPVALSSQSSIIHVFGSTHLADAFAVRLPSTASTDPDLLARFLFAHQPGWVGHLTTVRDAIVGRFGLKTASHLATLASTRPDRIGIFKVYATGTHEIVLGEDDTHLDFRVSLLCSAGSTEEDPRQLTISTVVHCHNLLGRAYLLVIAPFHRRVVQASLRRGAQVGWPEAAMT